MKPLSRSWLLVAALVAGGCSARPAGGGSGAISSLAPVETWMENREGEGNLIFFRNNTRGQIRITTIQLLECQNTSPSCRTVNPNLVLDPGQVRDGLTVRAMDPRQGFRFTYQYTWAQGGTAAAPPAPARAAPAPGAVSERVFVNERPLDPPAARALGDRFRGIRVMADSVVITLGQRFSLTELRVVAVDSAGRETGRLAAFDVSMSPGAVVLTGPLMVMAVDHGVSWLTIKVPTALWFDSTRARPEARVRMVVR
jgi:hypothetical protein